MTKLLDQIIAEVRKLSDDEQDRIAAELISYLSASAHDREPQLSEEQLAEVRQRRSDSNSQNLALDEVEARLRRHRA
jgi:hypothetical protein